MAETERIKPRAMYVEEAIQLALDNRWEEAVHLNHALIERHGVDEDALNRLGKALSEMGDLDAALDSYSQTLELNPLNQIAQKNTRKLAAVLQAGTGAAGAAAAMASDLFTEEPGKSALTVLKSPSRSAMATITPGDAVELEVRGTALIARTLRGTDLGTVESKIARRLLPLLSSGNRYSAAVARVEEGRIEVMLREVHQAPMNARKSSFPVARGPRTTEFRPYAKESLLSSRGADIESLSADDEDGHSGPGLDEEEEDLSGMQPVEGDVDEAVLPADADDEDDRPEDHL